MLQSPQFIDQMYQATAGDTCESGGVLVFGHFETPVDVVDPYDPGAGTLVAQPSFVCADRILPDIGYCPIEGARGVGLVVVIQRVGIDGVLEDEKFSFRVGDVLRVADDGGEIRIVLTDED